MAALACQCDVLVHDFALPERHDGDGGSHPQPSTVGRLGAATGCATLLLTHVMPKHEAEAAEPLEHVRRSCDGEIVVAVDLLTLPLGRAAAHSA